MKLETFALHNYQNIPPAKTLSGEYREAIEVVGSVLPFKANNYEEEESKPFASISKVSNSTTSYIKSDNLKRTIQRNISRRL